MEDWVKAYEVKLKVQSDVELEEIKSVNFWEGQSHSDESPYFLVTEIIEARRIP